MSEPKGDEKSETEADKTKESKDDSKSEDEEDTSFCKYCQIAFKSADVYWRHTRGMLHTQKMLMATSVEVDVTAPSTTSQQLPKLEAESQQDGKDDGSQKTAETAEQEETKEDQILTENNWMEQDNTSTEKDMAPSDFDLDGRIDFDCELCDVSCTGPKNFQMHIEGQKHRQALEASRKGIFRHKRKAAQQTRGGLRTLMATVLLESTTVPVIGLDYVTEFQKPDLDAAPRYFCNLCGSKCDFNTIIPHISGSRHRLKTLKENHATLYQHLTKNTNKQRRSELGDSLVEMAQKVESKFGRGQIRLKIEVVEDVAVDLFYSDLAMGNKSNQNSNIPQEYQSQNQQPDSFGFGRGVFDDQNNYEYESNFDEGLGGGEYDSSSNRSRYENTFSRGWGVGSHGHGRGRGGSCSDDYGERGYSNDGDQSKGERWNDGRGQYQAGFSDENWVDESMLNSRPENYYKPGRDGPFDRPGVSGRDHRTNYPHYRQDNVHHSSLNPVEQERLNRMSLLEKRSGFHGNTEQERYENLGKSDRSKASQHTREQEKITQHMTEPERNKGILRKDRMNAPRYGTDEEKRFDDVARRDRMTGGPVKQRERMQAFARGDSRSDQQYGNREHGNLPMNSNSDSTFQKQDHLPGIRTDKCVQEAMQVLSQSMISTEEDASVALQVSNALTQALLEYRLKKVPAELKSDIHQGPTPPKIMKTSNSSGQQATQSISMPPPPPATNQQQHYGQMSYGTNTGQYATPGYQQMMYGKDSWQQQGKQAQQPWQHQGNRAQPSWQQQGIQAQPPWQQQGKQAQQPWQQQGKQAQQPWQQQGKQAQQTWQQQGKQAQQPWQQQDKQAQQTWQQQGKQAQQPWQQQDKQPQQQGKQAQ